MGSIAVNSPGSLKNIIKKVKRDNKKFIHKPLKIIKIMDIGNDESIIF